MILIIIIIVIVYYNKRQHKNEYSTKIYTNQQR